MGATCFRFKPDGTALEPTSGSTSGFGLALTDWGDRFLVTTRGYHGVERLHLTTADFELIKQVNLTKAYSCIKGVIGRPRLFARDGAIYLHGRDYTNPMSLALYKVDPGTLQERTETSFSQLPLYGHLPDGGRPDDSFRRGK